MVGDSQVPFSPLPQNGQGVDDCLAAACNSLRFDFAEVWRRDTAMTGGPHKFCCLRSFKAMSSEATCRVDNTKMRAGSPSRAPRNLSYLVSQYQSSLPPI